MANRWKPVLTGAAVAATLSLPALADAWINGPVRTFNVRAVKIHDFVGNITIAVRDGGPVSLQMSGTKSRVDETSIRQDDGALEIEGESNNEVWDWRHWFDFSDHSDRGTLSAKLTVPRGSDVGVDDLVGDAVIGDTMGPLHFGAVSTNSKIGRVGEAHISLAGSGKVTIADVAGDLHVETAGSGKVIAGNTKTVHADVAGAGSIALGAMNGGLNLDIAGSGDFSAAKVNGPTHIDIAGSGSVKIDGGQANSFHIDILGSGNVLFGGLAVDPHVDGVGSGSVTIHAMRGNLSNSGMASVKIGD